MISFLQPLPIGEAVRCLLAPTAGSELTRVLRKTSDDISSATDPAAAVVFEGDERSFVDTTALVNGTPYFYRAFDKVGADWVASPSATATPAATAELMGPDALVLVRERFASGLKAEVAAGRLQHESGSIPTLTAPPLFENTRWPVFSVHFASGDPAERGIGEMIALDEFDDGEWLESEGWLRQTQIRVVGFSLNPDERNLLRRTAEKILLGNLPIFAAAGLTQISVNQQDVDDMETFSAPVYSTVAALTCLAPAAVQARTAPISDVTVDAQLAA